MLQNQEGLRVAVIVNDMASVNIDALLVKSGAEILKGKDKMVEMQNGCICCTLREDLIENVKKLAVEGRFDYLLIESTGISEPMPVATTFVSEYDGKSLLGSVARLDTLVTVVDALNFLRDCEMGQMLVDREELGAEESDRRTIAQLLVDQVECANIIVLNKVPPEPVTQPPKDTFPDGKDAVPGMFSARFDGGIIEHKFRHVHKILKEHNFPVLMVDADVGDDFGKATTKYLNKIEKEKGVLICVCTAHYAEKTSSPFCSFKELQFALDYSLDVLPLKVADVDPPQPPGGPDHQYDKDYEAESVIKMVFRPNLAYKDCRDLDEMQIARVIADKLLKKKTMPRQGSGHG
ncbi:yciC [Symbiodinium sp. CCMP2592]|nr:yciC [Symbiodinium sp. CCMP2592]